MARVNRAAFQPFRRCERSRISFFVSGNGAFLSGRPGEFMSRHGPTLLPAPPPHLSPGDHVDKNVTYPPSSSPPTGSIYRSCNNSKISVYFTGEASNFPKPLPSPSLFSRNLYLHACRVNSTYNSSYNFPRSSKLSRNDYVKIILIFVEANFFFFFFINRSNDEICGRKSERGSPIEIGQQKFHRERSRVNFCRKLARRSSATL